MTESRLIILRRVYIVYAGIILLGFAIVFKVLLIQVAEGPELLKKAQEQELRYFTIEANRGNIISADGSLMAISVPIFEIRMDVASPLISNQLFAQKVDSLAYRLATLFRDRSKYEYKKMLVDARQSGNRYLLIKKKVTYEQLKQLRSFPILRKGKYRGGLIARSYTKREMPYGDLAKRTIGFEVKQEKIFVGLEGAYGDILAGRNGTQLHRRLSHGDWMPLKDENQVEPVNGKDIVTTIDINIQDVSESALRKNLAAHEAFQGCAIVMEVETGHLKAIANLRLNKESGRYEESYNYAIGEKVEPGSTFKLASIMALLEDGKVSLNDTIDVGDGWVMFYGHTMQDVKKIRDGRITVREAFEKSSNVGISQMVDEAYRSDPSDFIRHLKNLRLHEPLGLNIRGEASPVIKDPSDKANWYGTTLPWMSIGYELMLTPLQILTFYNAVANDGRMVKPMLVKEIRQSGKTIERFETETRVKKICSNETLDSVKALLEGVVEHGTATSISNARYKIAGKTGTARVADKNRGYKNKIYNSSFAGYFPADNPKYSCIVIINDPKKGYYYGSSVAAPVFKEIADRVYASSYIIAEEATKEDYSMPAMTIGLQEDIDMIFRSLELLVDSSSAYTKWIVTRNVGNTVKYLPRRVIPGVVPNVIGMTAKDAVYLLESLGIKARILGRGIVTEQSVESGAAVSKNSTITLKLST